MIIKLTNVRLSFPCLWTPRKFSEADTKGSYSASFILDKTDHAKLIADIRKTIDLLVREKLKGKNPGPRNICLRDGSEKPDTVGYGDGIMFINARTDKAPLVVDERANPLEENPNKPVGGDYVNATIELWAQDNAFGKRINAKLRGVQFFKRGEAFGSGRIDPKTEFAPIAGENDEFTAVADDESPV